jgi:peptidoglycan/LPS O-acetylase OafA/YrhL
MHDTHRATPLAGQQQTQANPGGSGDTFGGVINSRTLDIGRILGASTIFYFHIGLSGRYPLSSYGEYAVEYFVMLAGIAYILFSRSKPSGPSEYFDYMKKRLAALFPMFLLVNLVIYLGGFLYPSSLGRPFRFIEFLASAAGVSQYFGWKYMSTVMWFMPFIMQVYLLFPLVDWTARRVNPVVLVLIAFGLSYLLAQAAPLLVKSDFQLRLVCKNWSPVFRLPEVCVGIILGRIVLTRRGHWSGILAVAVYGILSLPVCLLPPANTRSLFYMPWGGFVVPAVLFGASALLSPVLRATNAKWVRVLGLSSFPFFLLHAAPLTAISRRFQDQATVWVAYYLACWLVAIALTLFLAQAKNRLAGGWHRQKN